MRLGSIVFTGYEPVFLARELGWLDDSMVRLIELFSNTDSLRALAAGQIEAAQLTLDEFVTARADGLDLRIVAVLDESAGADAVMIRPGVRETTHLKGLRIAVEDGAAGAVMLAAFLRDRGLAASDVQILQMTLDRSLQVYHEGLADLFISAEPWLTQLEAAGAVRLFDSRALPGRIMDVMAVRADALERHTEALHHLVPAHFRAVQFMKNQPDVAARLMAPRLNLPPHQVITATRGLVQPDAAASRQMLQDGSPFMERLQALEQAMLEDQLIGQASAHAPLFESRFHP